MLNRFIPFGFFLGAAFQIQDDLLNLCADERYGKELNGDLWEGKRTLMLIQASRCCSAGERAQLAAILQRPWEQRTAVEVAWMRELLLQYEYIDYARKTANELAGAALHEFTLLSGGLPDSREKRFLGQMPAWVIERS
jgi:geranylgeranyl diphosphate synthase type II